MKQEEINIKYLQISKLKEYENNPRHNENAVEAVAESIKQFGFKVPVIIDSNYIIVAGHTRVKAAKMLGLETVPCVIADDLTPEQIKAFRLADNKTAELAEWDFEKLDAELAELADLDFDMEQFGFDNTEDNFIEETMGSPASGNLSERFIVPPFSVLDTRQGYWQKRCKMWNEKIQDDGSTRGTAKLLSDSLSKYQGISKMDKNSVFDATLAEIIVRWFMPEDCNKVFDTFAGDTVFGYVAGELGKEFRGIELREEQADFNNSRTSEFNCKYYNDDGRNIDKYIEENSQDLFFSCPPYFDLEVYSDKPNDASNQGTYEEFYEILDEAFSKAITRLKNNRFAVVVMTDIRNRKTGEYYPFFENIKETFAKGGCVLYNEAILVNCVGTAAIRASKYMKNRKLARLHQKVLVFYKGDTSKISSEFPQIDITDEEASELFYAGENME